MTENTNESRQRCSAVLSLQLMRVLSVADGAWCATTGSSPCDADQLLH